MTCGPYRYLSQGEGPFKVNTYVQTLEKDLDGVHLLLDEAGVPGRGTLNASDRLALYFANR